MVLKDKTVITFHSGILTIGGTVIEIAYNDAHIFFDFGTEYHPEEKLEDEWLQTLVEHRMVPHLKNVYDPKLDYTYIGDENKTYNHTAVFLSHAHLDHSRMINYLDPQIPLYTLKETQAILQLLNRKGDFLLPSPYKAKNDTREMIGLSPNDVIQVGDISVEVVRVDHDAYGACALLIKTPTHHITYSGDLRLHGHNVEDSLAFCEKAKHTDLLMLEGVSVSFPEREVDSSQIHVDDETDLIDKIVMLQQENPNRQLSFNGYPANILRFAKIIESSIRTVVLEATMAALLLETLGIQCDYYYTENSDFIPELDIKRQIAFEQLLADDTQYFFQAVGNFEKMKSGGLYIHSDAQPLGDFDPAYSVFLNKLEKQSIEFVRLACSGHAKPKDLAKIIGMIQPKCLVPIHTLKPEVLENPYGERILPVRGEKIVL